MWLTNSSIGRKLVMALSGACLVLFVTFHVLMNAVCILWPAAYNQVCMFLGANWYALIASAGLGLLVILHIVYAVWLTIQNRKARGADRYAVSTLPPHVEWSSKNMLVLGIVILVFLAIHLINFWSKMQLAEIIGVPATADGKILPPEFGTLFIQNTFSCWLWVVVYLIGFAALWLHLNHGFWSMFQTTGWNGRTWLPRLKTIGCWWTSIVVGLFVVEAVVFTIQAKNEYYYKDAALQEQYAEYFAEKAEVAMNSLNEGQAELAGLPQDQAMAKFADKVREVLPVVEGYVNSAATLCPNANNPKLNEAKDFVQGANDFLGQIEAQLQMQQQQQQLPSNQNPMMLQGDEGPIEIQGEETPAPDAAQTPEENKK